MKQPIINRIVDACVQMLESFSFIMREIVGAPLKSVRNIIQRATDIRSPSAKGTAKSKKKRNWSTWLWLPIVEAIQFTLKSAILLISFPYRFTRFLVTQARAELIWCLPAILVLFMLGLVTYRVLGQNQQIQTRYRSGLSKAMRTGDFETAKTYCQRLVSWRGEKYENDRLNLALCCFQTGDLKTGAQLLNELAPSDAIGYEPAHRYKAILLGQRLATQKTPEMLEELYHHLQNSGEQTSEQIQITYAFYHVEVGNQDQAIPYLRTAARKNPIHYLTMAKLFESTGKDTVRLEALRNAERDYRSLLLEDATNHEARINLAAALAQLGREREAQNVLEQGRLLKNDPVINRALADFCVMLFDQSEEFDQKLNYLRDSLNFDVNYLPAYQRIIGTFRDEAVKKPTNAKALEDLLLSSIATGDSIPLAHFAMSSLRSIQNDREGAQFHIERAFSLDPKFGAIANNLAWLLATDETNQDLDRALELSTSVVKNYPDDPRFRDTLGTILLKREQYDAALNQFEKILPIFEDKIEIHAKLATIYTKLDKPEIASKHQLLIKSLKKEIDN